MPSLMCVGRGRLTASGLCAVVAVLLAAAPAPAAGASDVDVFPPQSKPFGKTYGEWSARWWKQAVRQTGEPGTPFAAGQVNCGAMGTRNVVFLVGTTTVSPIERTCSVSKHAAILFPLINAEWSEAEGACPLGPDLGLSACAASFADTFTNVRATVDGMPLERLARFRFASPLFRFSPVEGNVFGIAADVGSPSVADGYWVMIEHLKRGTHTLTFGGDAPPFDNFKTDTTYRLTVR